MPPPFRLSKEINLQTEWAVGGPHLVCNFVNRMRVSSGSKICKSDEIHPLPIRFTNLLMFCKLNGVASGSHFDFSSFYELLECYVTDMDSLCIYSDKVNKVSDINDEHESGSFAREEDCILDFTTDKV